MKTLAAFFILAAAALQAEESQPLVFSGIVRDGSATRVALTTLSGGESKWVNVGQQFQGYAIVSYDENSTTLVVNKDNQEFHIALQKAKISPPSTPLTPENRSQIQNNLRLLWLSAQRFFIETGKTSAAFGDLVGDGKYIKAIEPVSGEDYTPLIFSADAKGIAVHTASGEIVSFIETLYAVKPGDSFGKIARAQGISVADLQSLNPGLNPTKLRVGQVIKVSPESK
jgi:LysM repeat protein